MATNADDDPGGILAEANAWWLRFNNGAIPTGANDEDEDSEDEGATGGRKAATAASSDGDPTAAPAPAPAEKERHDGDGAAPDGKISEDSFVQLQEGLLLGRKRAPSPSKLQSSGTEIQNKKGQAEHACVVVKNDVEMVTEEDEKLGLQLALTTEELQHEENCRLKLELALKVNEVESLRKQNEELRDENECYKKCIYAQGFSKENEKLRLQLALKTKELENEENRRLKLELSFKEKEIQELRAQNEQHKNSKSTCKEVAAKTKQAHVKSKQVPANRTRPSREHRLPTRLKD